MFDSILVSTPSIVTIEIFSFLDVVNRPVSDRVAVAVPADRLEGLFRLWRVPADVLQGHSDRHATHPPSGCLRSSLRSGDIPSFAAKRGHSTGRHGRAFSRWLGGSFTPQAHPFPRQWRHPSSRQSAQSSAVSAATAARLLLPRGNGLRLKLELRALALVDGERTRDRDFRLTQRVKDQRTISARVYSAEAHLMRRQLTSIG